MLNENIKAIRKSKGLSQEELAVKLNVVRQTVSKWEQGLSVPDSELLVAISKNLDVPVNVLLGEPIIEQRDNELRVISEKLEIINLQLMNKTLRRKKITRIILMLICVLIILVFIGIVLLDGKYLNWDYNNPQTAVLGVGVHSFVWLFVRIAPFILVGSLLCVLLTFRSSR